jgi:rare lipoprotein A
MTVVLLITLLLLAACGHPKQAGVDVPPPPPPASASTASGREPSPPASASSSSSSSSSSLPAKTRETRRNDNAEDADATAADPDLAEPTIPAGSAPIATETGKASWYGPPYHNRRGSNGEVYNMHAMTAAHRTLPLGSIVRVTNLKTEHSALVRITDRGPFIPGRVLDLSLAAARKLDVYQPGIAEVKVEVMETPAPLDSGGKWAVQIGSFPDEDVATEFADHLTRRYRTAKVLRFASPAGGWWIRIRVLDDDHDRAQQMVAETRTREGAVFLVRLD